MNGLQWMAVVVVVCSLTATAMATASCQCPQSSELAEQLRRWLATAGFERTLDTAEPGRALHHVNNVDMAVIGLPPADNACNCSALFAQVLLSRDFPDGLAVQHTADTLESEGVDWRWWDYERWDSYAPGAWTAPRSGRYFGPVDRVLDDGTPTGKTFMMAHPASCFKLMVATGVLLALNDGRLQLQQAAVVNVTTFADVAAPRLYWNGTVDSAMRAMITVSDNSATTALLALLHEVGVLQADWHSPDNELAALFRSLGLHLLRLEGTQPGGYWGPPTAAQRNRSSDYDTTGFYHMGAFDACKLLWLLSPFASLAPGYAVATPTGQRRRPVDGGFVAPAWKAYLYSVLKDQAYHEVLSSTAICGRPHRRAGIPSYEPARWITAPGNRVVVDGDVMSDDVTPCQQAAAAHFFHKTGSTYTFGSNAGFVVATAGGAQYIVAIVGNLGTRFIDRDLAGYGDPCAALSVCYTQNIPHIGRQLHDYMTAIDWSSR